MRALFFGTPDVAVPALEALHDIADVVGVVCQPDRPAGRGMTLRPPAIKVAAERLGLPVHQPAKIKRPPLADWVAEQNVDVALVMAYGRILPQAVLDAPRRGCMNLHASLLPKLRGAAPINWAVARGEKETGICLMQMDAGMDTGAVLSSRSISIGPDETAGELADRLAQLAARVVRDDLLRAVEGKLTPQPQAEAQATYAPVMTKDDGRIDWSAPAEQVHAHVRGMTPWPGAFTTLGDKPLKVLRTRLHGGDVASPAGTLVIADSTCVLVACGAGLLELVSLQLPGKKGMPAGAMVVGRTLRAGDVLGVGSD
ncbi:MAG: methionyl-tRNA formyltransferase [Deltaproteobacteria bacterium HGW-Deltaproteobacteria-20]|nr:MAG: methionyl-tRNA formyltransferase [Deltaproteobacteria bacterium HGW-Deltaproteobacteria-20]